MLYEVITLAVVADEGPDKRLTAVDLAAANRHADRAVGVLQVAVAGARAQVDPTAHVITSYSIHYTKLYDNRYDYRLGDA